MTVSDLFALGLQHHQAGNFAYAEQVYRQVLQADPHHADALAKLANVLFLQGNFDAAIDHFRHVLRLRPHNAAMWYNLGLSLQRLFRDTEAVDCYRQTVKLEPALVVGWLNLGTALRAIGNIDEAIVCYRHVLQLQPDHAGALGNIGNALTDMGDMDEAAAYYRRALDINPDLAEMHSNLLCALNYCSNVDGWTIRQEHDRWNRQQAAPLARFIQPHTNDRSPNRKLRIGYVSPDFRWHPVGRFILPLLEAHDRGAFEVFCYASQNVDDALTAACRAQASVWRAVATSTDEQLAQQIRQDRIDILVDLTMHMGNNRLMVFARKPAPVQVTYLAYCSTTGLATMDYRLTDPYLDPPGADQRVYSEKSVCLPDTYWCYRQVDEAPDAGSVPALASGHVTFGSMNNFCKVTPPTLTAWSVLLQRMPTARLLFHAHAGSHRKRVLDVFSHQGILADRVTFVDYLPSVEYFRIHQRIDICLDPFPYAGGTTTCDALWMGVPVVSLAGQTAVGRGGLSILSNLGLADLVANSPEQYIDIAVKLAGDVPRLQELRGTLRERMRQSPLMDAPRFARHVEAAYREMWRHCTSTDSAERGNRHGRGI